MGRFEDLWASQVQQLFEIGPPIEPPLPFLRLCGVKGADRPSRGWGLQYSLFELAVFGYLAHSYIYD